MLLIICIAMKLSSDDGRNRRGRYRLVVEILRLCRRDGQMQKVPGAGLR